MLAFLLMISWFVFNRSMISFIKKNVIVKILLDTKSVRTWQKPKTFKHQTCNLTFKYILSSYWMINWKHHDKG